MIEVKVTDNSDAFRQELEERTKTALEMIGLIAESHATDLTPVDTGLLRNSITHAVSGEPPAKSSYKSTSGETVKYSGTAPNDKTKAVYIGTNVKYGIYVELGARGRKPRHMLQRAISEHREEYKKILESTLKKG